MFQMRYGIVKSGTGKASKGVFPVPVWKGEAVEDKIQKWEEEIERIAEKQKEMNSKYSERIRELRKKIQEEEQVRMQENNKMIAEAVREIYGEVNRETLEDFKEKIKSLQNEEQELIPKSQYDMRM